MAIKEKWTKRQLERQIDTGLFNRYMASKTSKKTLLVPMEESKAIASLKDHYVLDFLGLEEVYSEKELRRAILSNLRDFFLEFGKNLTFVGEEYPLRVGDDFFKIDLLFYHRELCCLVPVELKLGKFKPEYVGQMQFYLAALDEQVRLYHERPSIGLILCKSKNDETVRIAISQAVKKIGVAIYQTKLPARKLLAEKLHQIQLPEGA
jgi:predicted nuclease of restriction endonuclease-like (RecB) superfamily